MDPGFVSAVIAYFLTGAFDCVLEHLEKVVKCKRKCKALESLLQLHRNKVRNIEEKLQNLYKVAQDDREVVEWYNKLREALMDAELLVQECGVGRNMSRLNFFKRHHLTNRIDKVHQDIEKLAGQITSVAMHLTTHLGLQQANLSNDYDAPGNSAIRNLRNSRERAKCLEEETRLRDAHDDNRHHISDLGHRVSARVHGCFHPHQHHDSKIHDAWQQSTYATNHTYMNNVQMPQQSSTYVQYPAEYDYVTAQPATEPQNQNLLNSWQ